MHVVEEVKEEHIDHNHNTSEEGEEQSHSMNVAIGEGGSSAPHDLALWQQVLDGQRAMMQQMEQFNARQTCTKRRQRRMSYKIDHLIEHSGYHIDSLPPSPQ